MKMIFILLLIPVSSLAQQTGDSKIMVKVPDTAQLYIKVKRALIGQGFTVRDDMNLIVLTTNMEVVQGLGYTIIKAEIRNDVVTIRGFYCNKRFDLKGAVIEPKGFSKIVYFKQSNGWPILKNIATDIYPSGLSFSK